MSGVWMADTSERAVFVNEQLARMLGRTRRRCSAVTASTSSGR